jgi:predicted RNA-binding Zn ribbon-like protein
MALHVYTYPLVAGRLALEFNNTGSERVNGGVTEMLHDYGDLLDWCERLEVLEPADLTRFRALAETQPAEAAEALAEIIALRETVYRIFSARAHGRVPANEDLERLNEALARALPWRRLAPEGACCRWDWQLPDDLRAPAFPMWNSAADILTDAYELERVKECTNESCSWLFLDSSKNRSRRWCEMRECGNRAKAKRHYQRKRGN